MSTVETEPATLFVKDVLEELRRAQASHAPMGTVHEASAVIREEFDEFWEEVKHKQHDKGALRCELVQVAAMCLRAVVDLDL